MRYEKFQNLVWYPVGKRLTSLVRGRLVGSTMLKVRDVPCVHVYNYVGYKI